MIFCKWRLHCWKKKYFINVCLRVENAVILSEFHSWSSPDGLAEGRHNIYVRAHLSMITCRYKSDETNLRTTRSKNWMIGSLILYFVPGLQFAFPWIMTKIHHFLRTEWDSLFKESNFLFKAWLSGRTSSYKLRIHCSISGLQTQSP